MARSKIGNPTHSAWIVKNYQKDLTNVFEQYRKDTVDAIYQASGQPNPNKSLESTLPVIFDLGFISNTLRQIISRTVQAATKYTNKNSEMAYTQGTKYADLQLKQIKIDMPLSQGPITDDALKAIQLRNIEGLRGITEETNKQIINEITTGIQRGEGMDKIAARINDRVDSIGIVRSRTLARTETMRAVNLGAGERFFRAGFYRPDPEKMPPHGSHPNCTCCVVARSDGKIYWLHGGHCDCEICNDLDGTVIPPIPGSD